MTIRMLLTGGLACCALFVAQPAAARDFTNLDIFLAYLKLAQPVDLEGYLPTYEKRFAPPASGPQTEFTRADRQAKLLELMKRNVAGFNLAEPVEAATQATFGEYDFERKAYDFRPMTATSYLTAGDIQVVFLNTRDFQGLPMEPEKAKGLLRDRPDRRVPILVTFLPVEAIDGSNRLKAKITRIDVFGDWNRQTLVHTMSAAQ